MKDPSSNRVNDLLINKTIPVNLYNIYMTFRDTDEKFELKRDLMKMITNKKFNVDLIKLTHKKLTYECKKMSFDERV